MNVQQALHDRARLQTHNKQFEQAVLSKVAKALGVCIRHKEGTFVHGDLKTPLRRRHTCLWHRALEEDYRCCSVDDVWLWNMSGVSDFEDDDTPQQPTSRRQRRPDEVRDEEEKKGDDAERDERQHRQHQPQRARLSFHVIFRTTSLSRIVTPTQVADALVFFFMFPSAKVQRKRLANRKRKISVSGADQIMKHVTDHIAFKRREVFPSVYAYLDRDTATLVCMYLYSIRGV
jgi:hypothetical protein